MKAKWTITQENRFRRLAAAEAGGTLKAGALAELDRLTKERNRSRPADRSADQDARQREQADLFDRTRELLDAWQAFEARWADYCGRKRPPPPLK